MSATTPLQLSQFALDVAEGLSSTGQKWIPPRYFYDDLGSTLFEAITLLPEYGLTRSEERLLQSHARDIAAATGFLEAVAELGSGSGLKTRHLLQAILRSQGQLTYHPIDVSTGALAACERQISDLAKVEPVCGDWMDGLAEVARRRPSDKPLLLLFLGSSIGNISRHDLPGFLESIRSHLRSGDFFLLGVDLIKETDRMLLAYEDPTGVTAAFNLNLLGRMNRELEADFNLRLFHHEVRWDADERRIEMHLRSLQEQTVSIAGLEARFHFSQGETIWTESSHKFAESELRSLASSNGFFPVSTWIDEKWTFAEVLWQAD
jgi:L-histidine N-alpha-methyltransferase